MSRLILVTESEIREKVKKILSEIGSSIVMDTGVKVGGFGAAASAEKFEDDEEEFEIAGVGDIKNRQKDATGSGAKTLDAVKDTNTHWNFKLTDGPPGDWNIKNYKPKDIVSRGNGMVVADKKALRALDKAASRHKQYNHPPILLTNQKSSSRNGAYRDPEYNKKQGGAKSSRHMYGDGFDIWTKDWSEGQRLNILKNLYDVGFHAFGHGLANIHADMRPGSSIVQWKYGSYKIPNKKTFISESKNIAQRGSIT